MELLKESHLLLLLLLTMLISSIRAQYRLEVELQPANLEEEGTLTVICKVTVTSHDSSPVNIVWVRRLVGERTFEVGKNGADEIKEVEIGRNATILDDFKGSKYQASIDEKSSSKNQHVYLLKVSKLKSTDSGEIGCRLMNNHIEIFKSLNVQKHPKKVSLASKNLENTQVTSYQEGEKVKFNEGQPRNFFCYVSEVFPEPRVRVLLGSKDITNKFNKSLRLTRTLANEGNPGAVGLAVLHYDVIMTSERLEFTYEFDNKSISCVADFPDGAHSTSSASISVTLTGYKPKFLCNHDHYVFLHQPNFELKCKVIGQPEATHARVHWKRHTDGNMSVKAGEKSGVYEALLASTEAGGKELIFRIPHIYPQHFRTYYLEADNAVGKSTYSVNLVEASRRRLRGHSSSLHQQQQSTHFLSFIILNFIFFFHF